MVPGPLWYQSVHAQVSYVKRCRMGLTHLWIPNCGSKIVFDLGMLKSADEKPVDTGGKFYYLFLFI